MEGLSRVLGEIVGRLGVEVRRLEMLKRTAAVAVGVQGKLKGGGVVRLTRDEARCVESLLAGRPYGEVAEMMVWVRGQLRAAEASEAAEQKEKPHEV